MTEQDLHELHCAYWMRARRDLPARSFRLPSVRAMATAWAVRALHHALMEQMA